MTNKILQYGSTGAKYGAAAGKTATITLGVIGVVGFLIAATDQNCKNESTCVEPFIAIGIVVIACLRAEFAIGAGAIMGGGLGLGVGLVHEGYSFFNKPKAEPIYDVPRQENIM